MERGAISGRPLVKSLSVGFIATRNLIARRTMPAFFFPPSIIVPFFAENRHASNLIDLYLEFKRNLSSRAESSSSSRSKIERNRGEEEKEEEEEERSNAYSRNIIVIVSRGELRARCSTKRAFDRLT